MINHCYVRISLELSSTALMVPAMFLTSAERARVQLAFSTRLTYVPVLTYIPCSINFTSSSHCRKARKVDSCIR